MAREEVKITVIDRIAGAIAGAIGGALMVMGLVTYLMIQGVFESSASPLMRVVQLLLVVSVVGAVVAADLMFLINCLIVPISIVVIAGIGGLFWGMCQGFNKGLRRLISDMREGRDPMFSSPVFDVGNKLDISEEEALQELQEDNHQALVEKIRALRNSVEGRQYVNAMLTPKELAEFKGILDAKGDDRPERDQRLYQSLAGQCQISSTSLLTNNDFPITIQRKNDEGRVISSTYKYFKFLEYLLGNQYEKDIVDPIQKISLNSPEVTFLIGFPDVTENDFAYIREQIGRQMRSAPVAFERTRALSTSSIQSSGTPQAFFNSSQQHLRLENLLEGDSAGLRFSPSPTNDSE